MHPYPHTYAVSGRATGQGAVQTTAEGAAPLAVAPPIQFDGPGNLWSPETLLCAAVADCLILTFRAIGRASKFEWLAIDCHVDGTLERMGGISRFTRFHTEVLLTVPEGSDEQQAKRLVEKSEQGCLIANSLNATRDVRVQVRFAPAAATVSS